MLTKTTISAIRALTYLGTQSRGEPLSPQHIAEPLGESPTYLAKVLHLLVRAGILRALRGVNGGVVLRRDPRDTSLLAIVEACQGAVLGRFCEDAAEIELTCAFHQAAAELQRTMVQVMSRWSLQQFIDRPGPDRSLAKKVKCWMEPVQLCILNPRRRRSPDPAERTAAGKPRIRREQGG